MFKKIVAIALVGMYSNTFCGTSINRNSIPQNNFEYVTNIQTNNMKDSVIIVTDSVLVFQNINRQTIAQESIASDIRINSIIYRFMFIVTCISTITTIVMISSTK